MAWQSSIQTATELTSIANTIQWFDNVIDLNPGELVACQVEVTLSGSTDVASVHVRSTLEDTNINFDTEDVLAFTIPSGSEPARKSFMLSGMYRARIGIQSTGATDTHQTASLSYRSDGVNAG
jgi:hypothetical protein